MKNVKIDTCPFCGGNEFIECKLGSYGSVYVTSGGLRADSLFGTVCRNCGSVVRTYCQNPEKLYHKKDRRN